MKLLAYLLSICSLSGAEVITRLVNDGGLVLPDATLQAEFFNKGNDIVHVVINGVDKGDIIYPYKVTYTSKPIGQINTFVVTTCSYMGATATLNFTTISQGKTYNKAPGR